MSDFELPSSARPVGVKPTEDFEVPEDILLPPVESDFETQQVIDRAPQPEQAKKILEQATAIHNVAGLSWDDSFSKANTLVATQEPQAKKLGQAITDRYKAEQLTTRMGQAGNAALKAFLKGDAIEYEEQIKKYDSLASQFPALEDVAPAYPDGVFGAVLGFGRRMLTGAAGLIGQQVEIMVGEQTQEEIETRLAENPLTATEIERKPGVLEFIGSTYASQLRGETSRAIGFGVVGKQQYLGIGEVEAGNTFVTMVKAGVDPGIASRFAIGIGAINNALEFASVVSFVKMFPGADKVIGKVSSRVVRKLLLGPALRNKALRLAAKLAIGTTEQMAQELAQEIVTFYGENWATEINNATKGTELEGNKDFAERTKQLVYDFLPGVLAMGAIPIGMQAFQKGEKAKATAKPAPTPMETVRTEVAKAVEAETPAAARATLDVAETAKAAEIEQAEVLTPQLVNEAVELAQMQEAVEEQAQVAEKVPAQMLGTISPLEGIAKPAEVVVEPGTLKDETGKPLIVFHGQKGARIEKFSREKAARYGKSEYPGLAFWFSSKQEGAKSYSGKYGTLAANLSMQNPVEMTVGSSSTWRQMDMPPGLDLKMPGDQEYWWGDHYEAYPQIMSTNDVAIAAKNAGHDGVIIHGISDEGPGMARKGGLVKGEGLPSGTTYGVLNPEQIKIVEPFSGEPVRTIEQTQVLQPKEIEQAVKPAVESGQWVEDAALGQFAAEPWAKSELASREDLRELASYLADTNQATSFDAFVAAAKELEVTPRSEEYYRGIWDTTAKAEVELDEAQEVSTEAMIDATIAAEEKQTTQRVPVTDRLLAELEATPAWTPETETISKVLAEKELVQKPVEGEELDPAQMANEVLRKKKRLIQRMTHDFLKPPSAGIGAVAVNKIRALQAPYTTKETRSLNKAKKALTTWRDKHPGQALIPEAQALMDIRGIKDISVGELIDLYKESRELRKQGAIEEKARRERIKARRVQMATDLLSEIPGGVVAKRKGEFASATTQKQEKAFARKGKIKSNMLHPLRLFQSLGSKFQDVFWDQRKAWEGREITRQKSMDRSIKELKERTGVTATEMLRKLPGTDYYIDDLMTYYGQMKDPNGRKAVLWGNDEDETKISRLVAELPQKYRDFVDGVIEMNRVGYPDVERVQIEQNGTAAPKVDVYLPIPRIGDFGKPFSQELSTQAAVRESARVAGLQKSFTIQRKTFKEGTQQARFRTDFLNILAEQIAKESTFVEGEEWARDMGWLLGGKSKESKQFLEAVKQKHGQPVVTFLKDYVNAVIQPESFNGKDFHGLISRVFRNSSDAALMYKLSTAFIQVEGPFRYLSQLDAKQWPYLAAGIWKATIHQKETLAAMYERSPVMQAMADTGAIDPALQEGRGLRHARSEIGLNLQMARKAMREGGYFLLKGMNKWTIASGWTAVYQANLAKTGNVEAAVKAADEATFLTQPSGELADAPRIYWTSKKNIILSFLQRFSRANNQMAQMMTVDLWKDLKTGHPAKALGVVLSFAIGAYLNGLRRRKRPPKDAEEYLEDGIAGVTDTLGAMTFGVVPAVVAGATGGFRGAEIKPLEPFYAAGAIAKDIVTGDVSNKEIWRLINTVMQATGLPAPAAENLVRTAYDFEEQGFRFDPIELFGRRPRE